MEELDVNYLTETITHFSEKIIELLPSVVAALVTLIFGLWLANFLSKRLRYWFNPLLIGRI